MHTATWMLWPTRPDIWRENATPIQSVVSNIAKIIAKFEKVYIGVTKESNSTVGKLFTKEKNIEIVPLEYNDIWIRDTGPEYIVNDGVIECVKWDFNSWGGLCYSDWDNDNKISYQIAQFLKKDIRKYDIVLEGGAITTDGEGTLITTKECVLDPKRNPGLTQAEAEKILKMALGVKNIIWLDYGLEFDETLGHIDNVCQFIRPGEVILNWTNDKNDPQHIKCSAAYKILSNSKDARGKKLKIHKIIQPDPIHISSTEAKGIKKVAGTLERKAGQRLPASYINLYIGNKFVLVPTFNDKHDSLAIEKIKEIMPDHEIIGVYSKEILIGGGNIHCILHQQP